MPDFDLIIRGGTLVTSDGLRIADLGVAEGVINEITPNLAGTARKEITAQGLHIFPGVLDAHVHFNEPGRADWEGLETGSRALAAGGGTLFVDMPLNAHPPTIDAASFDLKAAAARMKSVVDFALWGGLVPGNLAHLGALAERGVIGFKAFMANSGIEDFPRVDDSVLREGMEVAAKLGLPVAVHAESEQITSGLARACLAQGKMSIRDYLTSRPVAAELDAIRRTLDLAAETGCALHVVHVSCGEGVHLIAEARQQGVDVSAETCPHYLVLGEEDMETLGAVAKCAPPLRAKEHREDLWRRLLAGEVTTIGSDHSPAPPEMKRDPNFFKVWGGISGAQHTLPLLITETAARPAFTLPLLARLLCTNVAQRFKLPGKGGIAVGNDADLVLVDLNQAFTARTEDLLYRHPQTPYAGRTLQGRVRETIVRGERVFANGRFQRTGGGRLVKPAK
jgi:allantoinase